MATEGREQLINAELGSDLDAKGYKIKNADLSESTNVDMDIPTVASTTNLLKGDDAGNAVEATELVDYWDDTVAFTGASSSKGLCPDPGADGDSSYFLARDMQWRQPAGEQTVPTVASTSSVLKGDGAGNAVAATALTDYWNGTVAVASGASHAKGLVPDPGVTGGTSKFLREDMTYAVPPASAGVVIANTTLVIKGDNAGGGVAATPGTLTGDYVAPSTALGRLLAATTALSGTTPAINWNTTTTFSWTLSGNSTPTFSNDTDTWDITIAVTNTASDYTLAWPVAVQWSGNTQPTQTVGAKTDLWGFKKVGSILYGAVIQNMT